MIRVREFEMDGVKLKLASMNFAMAEKFVEDGKAFLEKMKAGELRPQAWMERRNAALLDALKRAGTEWDEVKLKEELDIPLIEFFYDSLLKFSGLTPGEAVAVSASPSSEAA